MALPKRYSLTPAISAVVFTAFACITSPLSASETDFADEDRIAEQAPVTIHGKANPVEQQQEAEKPSDELVSSSTTTHPLPIAEPVNLEEPVVSEQEPTPQTINEEIPAPAKADDIPPLPADQSYAQSLFLLGKEVQPGITTRLSWSPAQSFEGVATPTPVLVAHGSKPGPILCLTASIHGDELNGIEIVRRVLHKLNPEELSGTVIGVPIVNLQGFHRASRYLSDRRDLNRYFPGNPNGSSASRIAHSFFNQVVKRCNYLVDLHTGSFHRTNLPQLRADLSRPDVAELTHGFGATVVLHSAPSPGTLRAAAVEAGIPTVTLEAGGPMELQEKAVSHGVKGIRTLLSKLGMTKKSWIWGDPEPVYYESTWVRAHQGGILFSKVELGEQVKQGDLLGEVTNPINNVRSEILSPHNGRILGMALNQVVQPGFAAYRVGVQQPEEDIIPAQISEPTKPDPDPAADQEEDPEPDLSINENDDSATASADNEISE